MFSCAKLTLFLNDVENINLAIIYLKNILNAVFKSSRISYPEEGKEEALSKRKIRWAKFFSSDYSIMCPFITEVVKKELLLVYYVNIAASEESLAGEEIGTCQIIDWHIKRQTSVKCKKKRVLVAGCNATIPAKTSSEVEIR